MRGEATGATEQGAWLAPGEHHVCALLCPLTRTVSRKLRRFLDAATPVARPERRGSRVRLL
jgi:hypothetical protein